MRRSTPFEYTFLTIFPPFLTAKINGKPMKILNLLQKENILTSYSYGVIAIHRIIKFKFILH